MTHTSSRFRNFLVSLIICALLTGSLGFSLAASDPGAQERKMGADEAAKFAADKTTKFITDPALVARIESIGNAIASVANEKSIPATYGKSDVRKFNYTFKIVDDKDINAFSLPGGYVYVNKGLIDSAQSDDELAGVIAHEIGHIAHHHIMQLLAENNKDMAAMAAILLAGALGGVKGDDLFKIFQVGGLLAVAKSSAYGQKAEFDADRTAVVLLAETKKYNPAGILTLMERLARDEQRKPGINYGIFMNHPPSDKRAHEIIDEMVKLGLPINRRLVTSYTRVQIKPIEHSTASSIWISDTEIIQVADSGGIKAAKRAESIAAELRNVLVSGARYHNVKLDDLGRQVVILGEVVLAPTKEDAALANTTVPDLAAASAQKIKKALVKEMLNEGY